MIGKTIINEHLARPTYDATGIILAGGRSSRMGRDKSILPLSDDSLTMTEEVWQQLSPLCREMLIVGNCHDKFDLPDTLELFDCYEDRGPLAGIQAGLKKAAYDYVFVASCDLAFFNQGLAAYLLSRSSGYDLVIPRHGGLYEPLFAVYQKRALPVIEELLEKGERKVTSIIPRLNTLAVGEKEMEYFAPIEELFYNVNTPDDYQKAKSIKRGKR